ncbi:MAG: hypothetical protein AAGI01_16415 [Myxococcota bacterium]
MTKSKRDQSVTSVSWTEAIVDEQIRKLFGGALRMVASRQGRQLDELLVVLNQSARTLAQVLNGAHADERLYKDVLDALNVQASSVLKLGVRLGEKFGPKSLSTARYAALGAYLHESLGAREITQRAFAQRLLMSKTSLYSVFRGEQLNPLVYVRAFEIAGVDPVGAFIEVGGVAARLEAEEEHHTLPISLVVFERLEAEAAKRAMPAEMIAEELITLGLEPAAQSVSLEPLLRRLDELERGLITRLDRQALVTNSDRMPALVSATEFQGALVAWSAEGHAWRHDGEVWARHESLDACW